MQSWHYPLCFGLVALRLVVYFPTWLWGGLSCDNVASSAALLGDLKEAEAGLAAEKELNAQLADALTRLRAAHEEALAVPAQMELGFENKVRSLVATHEEARRMWMEERRTTLEEVRMSRMRANDLESGTQRRQR